MTLLLSVYRGLTAGFAPFAPLLYRKRLAKGKELPGRQNERLARQLPPRPIGPLVWMHGASIGESKLLTGLARAMAEQRPDLNFLFTSQTASSASLIANSLPPQAHHQMAPIDTPGSAKRFFSHWQPDLCIFAEGEIWPNLISTAHKQGIGLALVNARMTDKSLKGWKSRPKTAKALFSKFDLLLAANQTTAKGLSDLTGQSVACPGNLKPALAARARSADAASSVHCSTLSTAFTKERLTLLAASTHAGEEALLLGALDQIKTPVRLILAPRHIDRGDEIEALIKTSGKTYARRSTGTSITPQTDILLADTFGEMTLWYQFADTVYLGGGHAPGIGGHSPLEPLSFGLPIITGPHTDNFSDTYATLLANKWAAQAQTAGQIARFATSLNAPEPGALADYFKTCKKSLTQTLQALTPLLPVLTEGRP